MNLTKEQLRDMYRQMWTIRFFEDGLAAAYMEGKTPAFDIGSGPVPGEMHLAAGQEPVAVGVCAHLRKEDTVVGTHRPHHFAIAKGVPLNKMTAEMFGKETGLGKGKGGHMHLFDPEHKFSCSGIIGASLPPACGAALAAKKMGKDWVAVAFFGEGAANQGVVPRIAEPGGAVEAAGDLRLRGQQVGDLGGQEAKSTAVAGTPTARRPTACPACAWRRTTRSRSTRPRARRSSARAAARARA